MKVTFVVERPTQFEAPFYRFATEAGGGELEVLFTDQFPAAPVHDPELGRNVEWGIDLLGGYRFDVVPVTGTTAYFRARLRRETCDLLITNGYTRPVHRLVARVARQQGIVTALRLDTVGRPKSLLRRLARRGLYALVLRRLYDGFLATSGSTRSFLQGLGVPEARIGLFPYAVDVEHFRTGAAQASSRRAETRRRLGVPADARMVLAVCKLSQREAPWDLLRAAVSPAFPFAWVVIAGEGPLRAALEQFARERGLERLLFAGYVAYTELPSLYAAADLFVHPVREERWGVSVEEALACGMPVVASSGVGAACDLLVPGSNGFAYEAGKPEELAVCVAKALALPRMSVETTSREVLARWDYAATWRHVLQAAGRLAGRSVS